MENQRNRTCPKVENRYHISLKNVGIVNEMNGNPRSGILARRHRISLKSIRKSTKSHGIWNLKNATRFRWKTVSKSTKSTKLSAPKSRNDFVEKPLVKSTKVTISILFRRQARLGSNFVNEMLHFVGRNFVSGKFR